MLQSFKKAASIENEARPMLQHMLDGGRTETFRSKLRVKKRSTDGPQPSPKPKTAKTDPKKAKTDPKKAKTKF